MIPVGEIVSILRAAIAGKIAITCAGPTWDEMYAGDVAFWFGDWRVEIFNDCDSFDYINRVDAPDGRSAVFEDWWEGKDIPDCPENQLSRNELDALTDILKAATA